VPLRVGDVYQIRLRNTHNEFIAARILVDGLNTLPQNPLPRNTLPQYKFTAIAEWDTDDPGTGGPGTTGNGLPPVAEPVSMLAPRVSLESARYWLLPPRSNSVVPGFFENVGDGGSSPAVGHEFRVTTAPRSEAAQQGFTEQIGIITVAFYSTMRSPPPPPAESWAARWARLSSMRNRGALGTELGNRFETRLEREDLEIDQLLGIIHIHYADAGFVGNAAAAAVPTPAPAARQQVTPQPQRQPVYDRRGRLIGWRNRNEKIIIADIIVPIFERIGG
jgi:hypothetical protein